MLRISRLDLAEAHMLIEAAAAKAEEIAVPMCIAVADESGNLIAFTRMDGAKISSIAIAIDKAFTAAAARGTTERYNGLCVPGQPTFGIHNTNGGRFCIIGGGVPIIVEGTVIGAVGLSAGTAEQDVVCAEAAAAHFYEQKGVRQP
ncbi:heme-binding protein [Streptosporangium sp. NPDC051022]|uniref:GlcG/HbpS family heme-binding protein n=1 Tax=Streptosporangium sp. NPDC051022 TaxID=3155752 RepID=UPI003440B4BD